MSKDVPANVVAEGNSLRKVKRPIRDIASDILYDWKNVSPYAKPYLTAMLTLDTIDDRYFLEDAETIIVYGLSNMSSFRGENARALKAELKEHLPKR